MELAVLAVMAGLAAGLAVGRRPAALAAPPGPTAAFAGGAGVLAALAGGVGVLAALAGGHWIGGRPGVVVMASGYALLILFALLHFRHPGAVLVAAGLMANLAVVTVDSGMPVRGLPPGVQASGHHHGIEPSDHLTALADDIHLPVGGETISAGDAVASLGAAVAAFAWLEPAGEPSDGGAAGEAGGVQPGGATRRKRLAPRTVPPGRRPVAGRTPGRRRATGTGTGSTASGLPPA